MDASPFLRSPKGTPGYDLGFILNHAVEYRNNSMNYNVLIFLSYLGENIDINFKIVYSQLSSFNLMKSN